MENKIEEEFFEEALFYHDVKKKGWVSILQLTDVENSIKKQKTYLLKDLEKAIQRARKSGLDSWICMNDFNDRNRRVVNLERINVVFSDLDTYNSILYNDKEPEFIIEALMKFFNDNNFPQPSLTMFSGRGIQIKWLLKESLHPKELVAWKALQKGICDKLVEFGSDSNALDASRLLRIENTINTKSQKFTKTINKSKNPMRYTFEELLVKFNIEVEEVEIKEKKERKVKEVVEKVKEEIFERPFLISNNNNKEGNKSNFKRKSVKTLAWYRFLDLKKLVELRDKKIEGSRMHFLFYSLNFMAMSLQINEENFWSEAQALADRFFPKGDVSLNDLDTLFKKVVATCRGETVEFDGKKYTQLYTPTNKTLISIFGITEKEQKEMLTIIDTKEKNERHKIREQKRRIKNGAKPRSESAAQTKPWEKHGVSRVTYYRNIDKYREVEFEGVLHQA